MQKSRGASDRALFFCQGFRVGSANYMDIGDITKFPELAFWGSLQSSTGWVSFQVPQMMFL